MPNWLKKLLDKWLKKKPPIEPPVPPGPIDSTEAERALIEAGKRLNVRSIVEGTTHEALLREAREYAKHMASINRQDGHAGFEGRAVRIRQAIPGARVSEISSQSWPDQNLEDAAEDAFKSWSKSPGHWKTANGPAKFIGYSMSKGNREWFACGIVVK